MRDDCTARLRPAYGGSDPMHNNAPQSPSPSRRFDVAGPRQGSNTPRPMDHQELEFRRKAEACRRLAEIAESVERRELWLSRAAEWDTMATDALHKAARSRQPLQAR
jgi:hypothetical protein